MAKLLLKKKKEVSLSTETNEMLTMSLTGTLDPVVKDALKIEGDCEDFSTPPFNKSFRHYSVVPDGRYLMFDIGDNTYKYFFTMYSFRQFCAKLKIPVNYLLQCEKEGLSDLSRYNVERKSVSYDGKFFIRCYQSSIRGILSNKYTRFDTPFILDSLYNVILHNSTQFRVLSYFISPERFHLRIVETEKLDVPGEDMFLGFEIDSSDVGRSTLTIKTFLFKQVCTNGLTIPVSQFSVFKQRHIGIISQNDVSTSLFKAISNLSDIKEVYKSILVHSQKEKLFLPDEYQDTLKYIQGISSLSEEHSAQVYELLQTTYDDGSLLSLSHALTQVAQQLTLERRLEVESRAGKVLISDFRI